MDAEPTLDDVRSSQLAAIASAIAADQTVSEHKVTATVQALILSAVMVEDCVREGPDTQERWVEKANQLIELLNSFRREAPARGQ